MAISIILVGIGLIEALGGEVSLVTSIFMGFWGGFYDVWTATKK